MPPVRRPRSVALTLPPDEQWTLHGVLLDRIEGGDARGEGAADPPPAELVCAFEALDRGDTGFTPAELEAIRELLAARHHDPSWEVDRPRIERLLDRVTDALEPARTAPTR